MSLQAFQALKSGIGRLTKELNAWLETDLDDDAVREVFEQALRNMYGKA